MAQMTCRVPKQIKQVLFELCNNLCVYCREEQCDTLDHVIPFAITQDSKNLTNLVPCCKKCNNLKGNRRWPRLQEFAYLRIATRNAYVVKALIKQDALSWRHKHVDSVKMSRVLQDVKAQLCS